ncbi:MAG: hypothetical protein MZV49_10020 [Rhodopseudomonas palustris]|nr:hypothetical protein [Rhodopseudomonas palustris]
MMIQLYQPLNFMGMVYREIKQGADRHRDDVRRCSKNPEVKDQAGRQAAGRCDTAR